MNRRIQLTSIGTFVFGLLIIVLILFALITGYLTASASGSTSKLIIEAQVEITPTKDRLAEPTLPAVFSQADLGAQDFWLHCLPCHGDVGQGLTEEFRMLYPEEERNCWESGCHGNRPYENGWRLPDFVPPIIGNRFLSQYNNAAGLFAFIQSAMPFQDPGSLEANTYWQLTAFLIRENDLSELTSPIDSSNGGELTFGGISIDQGTIATPLLQLPLKQTPVLHSESPPIERTRAENTSILYIILGMILLWILILGFKNALVRD